MQPPPKPRTPFEEPQTDDEFTQRRSRQPSNVAQHLLFRKHIKPVSLATSLNRIAESQATNFAGIIQPESTWHSASSTDGSSVWSSPSGTSVLFSPAPSDGSSAITSQYSPQPSALASSAIWETALPSSENSIASTSLPRHLDQDSINIHNYSVQDTHEEVTSPFAVYDGATEWSTTDSQPCRNVKTEGSSTSMAQSKNREAEQKAEQKYRQSLKDCHDNQARAVRAAGVSLSTSAAKKDIVDSGTRLIYTLLEDVKKMEKVIASQEQEIQQLKRESEYFRMHSVSIDLRQPEDVDIEDSFGVNLSSNPDFQHHELLPDVSCTRDLRL